MPDTKKESAAEAVREYKASFPELTLSEEVCFVDGFNEGWARRGNSDSEPKPNSRLKRYVKNLREQR